MPTKPDIDSQPIQDRDISRFFTIVSAYLDAKESHKKADELNKHVNTDPTHIYRHLSKTAIGRYCNTRCQKYREALEDKSKDLIAELGKRPSPLTFVSHDKMYTAFHYAVKNQDIELLTLLIDAVGRLPEDEAIPDSSHIYKGINPLMLAIHLNHVDMVKAILNNDRLRNAWLNNINDKQQTPLYIAVALKIPESESAIDRQNNKEITGLLVQHQAKFGNPPQDNTELHIAAMSGKMDVLQAIIESYRKNHSKEDVEHLLNRKNARGNTPLHLALKNRNVKTAKLLVQNGAFVSIENNQGQTAIDVGKVAMKSTRWWQAMVEGGFGESACPMEATSGITNLLMNQFAKLNWLQGLALGIASLATLGLTLLATGAVFLINGYSQRRLNYGDTAQKTLQTKLEQTAADYKAKTIAADMRILSQLHKRVSRAQLYEEPILEEDKVLYESLLEKQAALIQTVNELPDRYTVPSSWQNLDPDGLPSLEKQRLYATQSDKRAALLGGIGKGLGTGSALASVLFSGLALIGFFTAPTIVGAVIMGIGLVGIIAISGVVAGNGYRIGLEEYGLKNQQLHTQMLRTDDMYDNTFEKIDKENIATTFDELEKVMHRTDEFRFTIENLIEQQATKYELSTDDIGVEIKERKKGYPWSEQIKVAFGVHSEIKKQASSKVFNSQVEGSYQQIVTAIEINDISAFKRELLSSPSILKDNDRVRQLIQRIIQTNTIPNRQNLLELLLVAYDQVSEDKSATDNLLHELVQQNNRIMVEALLKTPIGQRLVNVPDSNGRTPLHYAAELTIQLKSALPKRKANYAIAEALLNAGANPNATTSNGNTALHLAARGFVPIDKSTKFKRKVKSTLFNRSYNAQRDKSKLIRLLCQKSSNVDQRNDAGETALLRAVRSKNHNSALVLAEFGADIHYKDPSKMKSAIEIGKDKISKKRWKTAIIDSVGEASCPVESTVTITGLVIDKIKQLSLLSVTGLTILSIATFGVALVGAGLIFIMAAYKDKQVNYGDEAQQRFEIELINAKIQGLGNKRAKLDKGLIVLSKKLATFKSVSDVPEGLRKDYIELKQQCELYDDEISQIQSLQANIPEDWKFDPNAEQRNKVLELYATRKNKMVAALSGIGKGLGVASAVAGVSIALITAILGIVGGAVTLPFFGAGIPLITVGIAASAILAAGIGAGVGYYSYRSTKQEFGEMHQKNHRLLLVRNKLFKKNKVDRPMNIPELDSLIDTKKDKVVKPSKDKHLAPSNPEIKETVRDLELTASADLSLTRK